MVLNVQTMNIRLFWLLSLNIMDQGPGLPNIIRLSYDNAIISIDFLRYDSIAKL